MLIVMKPNAPPQDIEWIHEEIQRRGWGRQG